MVENSPIGDDEVNPNLLSTAVPIAPTIRPSNTEEIATSTAVPIAPTIRPSNTEEIATSTAIPIAPTIRLNLFQDLESIADEVNAGAIPSPVTDTYTPITDDLPVDTGVRDPEPVYISVQYNPNSPEIEIPELSNLQADADGNVWYKKEPEIIDAGATDMSLGQAGDENAQISEYQSTPEAIEEYNNAIQDSIFAQAAENQDRELAAGVTSPGINTDLIDVAYPSDMAGIGDAINSNYTPIEEVNEGVDWRFRISLARDADYLYKHPNSPGILTPLITTDGVLFPYTPTINVSYVANYEPTDIVHSNYKIYNYRNSSVDQISIKGEFTAQDKADAAYVLAVIHFFKSVTKMFYGQNELKHKGSPPPLCFLNGHGEYGFNEHPVVISNFSLDYRDDIDYIDVKSELYNSKAVSSFYGRSLNGLAPGGGRAKQSSNTVNYSNTRVPTKFTVNITCLPIVTRDTISNVFNLEDYASGKLLLGNLNPKVGGVW